MTSRPEKRWRHLSPLFLLPTLLILYFVFALGLRALGEQGLETLNSVREASKSLRQGQDWATLLESPHAGVELLAGLLVHILPDHLAVWTLNYLSLFGVIVTSGAVWALTRRLGCRTSAWAATILFATVPLISASATAVSTTALVLPFFGWFVYLSTATRQPLWSVIVQVGLAAILLLSWAPVVLWMALLVVIELVYRAKNEDTSGPVYSGLLPPSQLPIHLLLVPVLGILAATLIHPGFWEDVLGGWLATWGAVVDSRAPQVLYQAEIYPPHRLPLSSGLAFFTMTVPAVTVVAFILGLPGPGWPGAPRLSEEGREDGPVRADRDWRRHRAVWVWTLVMLAMLPWLLRSPSYGKVETVAMASPLLAAFAGLGLSRALRILLEVGKVRGMSPVDDTLMVTFLGLIIMGAPIAEGIARHPHHGTYYNVFAGGLTGASQRGHAIYTSSGLPLPLLESVFETGCPPSPTACRLHMGRWEPYLDEYVQMGVIPKERLTQNFEEATLSLRRPRDFSPRRPESAQGSVATTSPGFQAIPIESGGVVLYLLEVRSDHSH
jgi:hypothetical protein